MPQLVGQRCARCHAEIWTIALGHFCDTCGNPVHSACAHDDAPTSLSDGKCSTCNGDVASPLAKEIRNERESPARKRVEAAKKEQVAKVAAKEAAISNCFMVMKLGGAVVGFGILLIVREIRDARGDISLKSFVPGLGALIAGSILVGLSIWLMKRRR
jgi:hypothetical protein